jgi:hypothetical protein
VVIVFNGPIRRHLDRARGLLEEIPHATPGRGCSGTAGDWPEAFASQFRNFSTISPRVVSSGSA